jgi:hypothetical protein
LRGAALEKRSKVRPAGLAILAEIVALFAAIYAENKLFFAENVAIISAGGAEIVYP